MKVISTSKDGGPESTVWAHWLIELKSLFSVALLRFEDGSREEFHSHAFDSVSWLLRGRLSEEFLDGKGVDHVPGLRPIVTRREDFHRVRSAGRSWVLTFRGPWARTWMEFMPRSRRFVTLTHGRRVVG